MFQNIAVAYEDHPEAKRAFEKALGLADRLGNSLTVLIVAEHLPAYSAFSVAADPSAVRILEQDRFALHEALKSRVMLEGSTAGVEVSVHILEGDTVRTIEQAVENLSIDLLIVGLHRRSLRISSLWSTVYTLAQDLSCSVMGVH
jgi:nucleotide-binding universal stress UspA family protein